MPEWLPILISVLALVVAGASLGWNLYQGIAYQGRLQVCIGIKDLIAQGENKGSGVVLELFNKGRQPVWCDLLIFENRSRIREIFSKRSHKTVFLLKRQFPKSMQPGDDFSMYQPYESNCMLIAYPKRIGIRDRRGKIFWAKNRQVRCVVAQFKRDFPAGSQTADGGDIEWKPIPPIEG